MKWSLIHRFVQDKHHFMIGIVSRLIGEETVFCTNYVLSNTIVNKKILGGEMNVQTFMSMSFLCMVPACERQGV